MKKTMLILIVITIVIFVALFMVAYKEIYNNHKLSTQEITDDIATYIEESTELKTKAEMQESNIMIENNSYSMEVMSVELYDTLEQYPDYNSKYLYYSQLPDVSPDIYYEKFFDQTRFENENPTLVEEQNSIDWENMSTDEIMSIMNRVENTSAEYTSVSEIAYDFLFFNINYINKSNYDREVCVAESNIYMVNESDVNDWKPYETIYFDKSDTDCNDTSFFFRKIKARESCNYIIAYRIPEEIALNNIYFGQASPIEDQNGVMLSPALQRNVVKHLSNIIDKRNNKE